MPYRKQACHVCGRESDLACPSCGRGVCRLHTVSALLEDIPARRRRALRLHAEQLGGVESCQPCVEHAFVDQEAWVTIYRSTDSTQAPLLLGVLEHDGFTVRLLGAHAAALFGPAQYIFDQRIEVPRAEAEAALEVVEDFLRDSEVFEADAPRADDGDPTEAGDDT